MIARRSLRSLWTFCAVLLSTAAAAAGAWHWMLQHSLAEENMQAHRQLGLYAQAMGQRLDRYRVLPDVLALDAELREALTHPQSPEQVLRLNQKLEQANGASLASTLTLIDAQGVALAASNWRGPSSNVGEDYSFRPYVQLALAQDKGSFYGIGMTTGEAGYFLSRAITSDAGGQHRVLGLIAIKIVLLELEREWIQNPDIVLASDANGVVFLASNDDWRYRTLKTIDASAQQEMDRTQQYRSQPLRPLRHAQITPLAEGGALVQWQDPPVGRKLWQSMTLPETGWQLHILHDVDISEAAAWWAAAAAGGGWLALSLLLLYARQRQRLSALRQRSREELEALLKQHAQELRTAQDGIVAAAHQADAGHSQSLEHLPQGVVVIDAALNLVAWNSRYMELFRLPAGLLKVGMPVEELYRYNARRGLLGSGDIDEAIERRMQFLRSGKPHARESEKADGTVLEIRGNPLPDGGFVTSYADITSYKNAARELRSLADALEKRIADRTEDLAQAKREAEQANRYKSKFVAAAVHDLLQPLNAARVFVSLLRQHVQGDKALQLASDVEGALASQDDILNSLLDIARMESGQLEVQRRDFDIQPMLAQLGSSLGVLAQGHGLELQVIRCRARVHSDEALLRRIVQNFLSNAIRYTRRGRIVLGCRRVGGHLRIEVHDQGPGIPESLHREIFEEFRRLETGRQHERGAGLGLAIVDRLGRLLQHPIGLRSSLGRGSVFWVEVPLSQAALPQALSHQAAETTAASGQAAPLQGASAWCIGQAAIQGTAPLLQRWGCQVAQHADAEAALAQARNGPTPWPAFVVVDAAHASPATIRALLACGPKTPGVVWLSTDAGHQDAASQQASAWGWGVLTQPARPAALRALVGQLLLRAGNTTQQTEGLRLRLGVKPQAVQ